LALLQAEASAFEFGLANVPNVGGLIMVLYFCSKRFINAVRFFGLLVIEIE